MGFLYWSSLAPLIVIRQNLAAATVEILFPPRAQERCRPAPIVDGLLRTTGMPA